MIFYLKPYIRKYIVSVLHNYHRQRILFITRCKSKEKKRQKKFFVCFYVLFLQIKTYVKNLKHNEKQKNLLLLFTR